MKDDHTQPKWRLLDTGKLTAADNIALDETLLESRAKGMSPDTVRFLQFDPQAVLVGFNQCVEQEIRIEYCEREGIDINRRITGGGAIFFDSSQIGWEVICDRSFFNISIANPSFFGKVSAPVISALNELGINASFRPRNDIEVNGKKISGTGGTEEGNAFLFQGTLLVDFDIETMIRSLRIPVEKLKDKEISTARERVTCLREELEMVPGEDLIKEILKRNFEREFGIVLEPGGLNEYETALFEKKRAWFRATEWIEKVTLPAESRQMLSSINKVEGGLIRVSVSLDTKRKRIMDILITGDFFAYPKRTIPDLEAALRQSPANQEGISERITRFFQDHEPRIPGVSPADLVGSIVKALEKIKLIDLGIPVSQVNRIFTVRGTFEEILSLGPKHLLLPYCSKSIECGWRHVRECPLCGDCTISPATTLGLDKGYEVITILSFKDLMNTLESISSTGATSYIGCCCEAFYVKHFQDFWESGLPAILIDINNTTCYDLGKENQAYEGEFEGKTDIDLGLLGRIMDA